MKNEYSVIAGNVGQTYQGNNKKEALKTFAEYKRQSKAFYGRVSREQITLFCNGEVLKEYLPAKLKIKEFSISFIAEHEQYYQGHGIACSRFSHCSTGNGETLLEAFDDCISDLTEQGFDVSAKLENKIRKELENQIKDGYSLETTIIEACCDSNGKHIETNEDGEQIELDAESIDCSVCAGDWYFYVNLDVIAK